MSDLVLRLGDALDALQRDSARVPREVVRAVNREHGRGLVKAARVDARAYVAHIALRRTAQLSADEASSIVMAPLGEPRYRAIIDNFAIFAAGEVGQP
jgi:hypothetical protein